MPAGGPSVWIGAVIGALATALGSIIAAIPAIIGAILILLIGWGIGKLVQAIVTRGLQAVHFNDLTEHAGINNALQRADIKTGPSAILGVIAYWFVFLFAIQAAVTVLGIPLLTTLMSTVILYLPRIFAALLIVVVGAWAASFLARLTRSSATTARINYSDTLGSIVQGVVLFFAFTIALNVLGLGFPFLLPAFIIILGAIALGGALAFGLGGREYASDLLAGRELRSYFNTGDRLISDDVSGTIVDMKPTTTVIRTERGDIAMQNSDLMHKHVSKSSRMSDEGEGGGNMPRAA